MCTAALPRRVTSCEATIILLFNIFLPGVGTMLASIMGHTCRCDTLLVGFLQLITAPLIVGWVWSIWWGLAACGRVGKMRDDGRDDGRDGRKRRSGGQSDRHSRQSDRHSRQSGQSDRHSGQSNHRADRQSATHENQSTNPQQPQQGFPQAYPDPTYPAPAYQQPYPADYPSAHPPV